MFLGFVGVSVLLLVIGVAANNKEKTIRKKFEDVGQGCWQL